MFSITFICDSCGWKEKKIYTLRVEEFYTEDEKNASCTVPASVETELCHANFISALVEKGHIGAAKEELEESSEFTPIFQPALNHDGTRAPDLITVILQDNPHSAVLYAATMDDKALALTLKTMRVHLYSRSAKKMRRKGATSGDELAIMDILTNCNQDCLLIKVKRLGQDGGCCHTRINPNDPHAPHRATCFYRVVGRTVGKTTKYVLSFLE
ncbi:hypothetical protein A2477_03290 [Candidatus Falkowbacteria bacterium RIFOXYC2_FULL_47_12]|uniref:phosphoribosyl-AMP cyclohydrolase n=2 Tax=Candidatus Falkowiibacteriota TaxID=1752728 RepID=A0A1F5TNL4_9BACT|nr:MAG: hypothetical protein A2242_03520 [Candidatus Falkowbacteria bacterium RIFOXYA2_FULL_47_9]OGF40486.1 MAG: hypothetical protein A2477_03290 [Candidatus Falkowbacteria bacterium RIFOXYC2_FULL_47_12]